MKPIADIEINPDFARALDILEHTDKNVFITGKAGTGKSTLLQYFRETTAKNIAVLAPTGVAALNVKGQTIHSFLRFPPHIIVENVTEQPFSKKLQKLLQKIDAIVIDEVSMVRADLMDCIDIALRYYRDSAIAFGGLQMIFIGDMYQLPPVVSSNEERELFETYYESPYFFDAHVMENIDMEFIELEKIYRQKDQDFIELLNKIRNSSIEEPDIVHLNTRLDPEFDPDDDEDNFFITLTTTNAGADAINARKLARIKSDPKTYNGVIRGKFNKKHLPTSLELEVKIGAQIMLLTNDMAKRWVNGSIGKVIDITYDEELKESAVVVQLNNGKIVRIIPYTWEDFRYFLNKENGRLDVETVGSFRQYPFRLAWAVTIHKSQGKTFDNVIVDLERGSFAQGQVYVAISRCTSFEGLVLKKPMQKRHIWIDYHIMRFLTHFQYAVSEKKMPIEDKIEYIRDAVEQGKSLEILYLKANDTKSRRTIKPEFIGEITYKGITFLGIKALCSERNEVRTFRVDRILEIADTC